MLLRDSRWRTWLRGRTPDRLHDRGYFVSKARDCGDHEWYVRNARTVACYHCVATGPTGVQHRQIDR